MVGVEGVAHSQHICGQTNADSKRARGPDVELLRNNEQHENAPAHNCEQQDERRHPRDGDPLLTTQLAWIARHSLLGGHTGRSHRAMLMASCESFASRHGSEHCLRAETSAEPVIRLG